MRIILTVKADELKLAQTLEKFAEQYRITYTKLNVSPTRTNVDALVGRETVAKTDIDPVDGGVVKLMGELWLCRPVYDKVIKEGAKVRVVRVEGVSLMVEEVE
jgi:membrane protein implicated in regulation of membrane protease activity